MERADSADTTFGILAISVAECFGSESVSQELATSLRKVLPDALFLRATVRCGSGLFVTDDLLRPGYSMVSLVSLKYSLAGLAMKQGRPLTVRLPSGSSSFGAAAPTRIVACAPISIPPPAGANYAPLQVGALLVGSPGDLSVNIKAGLSRLAGMAGPALLTIGLSRVQHLSHLLSLRDADAEYIGLEEDLQDLPIEVARPQQSALGPPTQPLDLGSAVLSKELEAVAAAAAIAAAAVVNGGEKKASVLYNVDEGVEEAQDVVADSRFFYGKGASNGKISFDNDPVVNGKGLERDSMEGSMKTSTTATTTNKSTNGVPANPAMAAPITTTAAAAASVPLGLLLSYENSAEMESAFIATEARVYAASDAAFCLLYIIALLCSMWESSASQPPLWMTCTLAVTAMLPLIASISALVGNLADDSSSTSTSFYIKCRESLLMMLMLVPVVIAQGGGSYVDPVSSTLPCLHRAADLTRAFFMPLGCRIRFCWLLPAQILNLASIAATMPWVQLQSAGCGTTCAVMLGCTGLLPLVMTYRCEVKARQRIAALINRTESSKNMVLAASS